MSRRRRRSRRYGSIVAVPGLSGVLDIAKKDVKGTDVLIGGAVGVIGSAFLKGLARKFGGATYLSVSSSLGKFLPAVFGAATGAALYFIEKKSNRAAGHALGAASAGLALSVWDFAKAQFAGNAMLDFSSVTQVNLGNYGYHNGYGMVIDDGSDQGHGINGLGGMLVADTSDGLAELAALSMGGDDDGINQLMGM